MKCEDKEGGGTVTELTMAGTNRTEIPLVRTNLCDSCTSQSRKLTLMLVRVRLIKPPFLLGEPEPATPQKIAK